MSRLGIELLTVLGMPPVAHVSLAAELGCTHISTGLRGIPMHQLGVPDWSIYPPWSFEDNPGLVSEMKAAIQDTGVRISLGEGFRVRSDGDVRDNTRGLDLMAELGAERVNAVSMEPDRGRTFDQLAKLADMVIERGMLFTIEFAPPNTINSITSALSAIDHIGRDKCRLLIDAMHFFRSGATLDTLRTLDPDIIGYAQLCDAPLVSHGGTYMEEAMFGRLVPGEGELPLAEFVAALPACIDIGVEVPQLADTLADGDARNVARRAVTGALGILKQSRLLR